MSPYAKPNAIEQELILSCSAAANDEAARAQFRRLAQRQLDWHYVLATAEQHGVLPLLRARLDSCEAMVPQSVAQELSRACLANAARNLALTGELLRILALFEAEGIEAVPFKGPVLAEELFGTVSMRQFCDIDILVKPEAALRARDLLAARGYEPEFTLSPAREAEYVRAEHAFQLRRPDGSVIVELHWCFGSKSQAFPLSAKAVWQRLVPGQLQGTTIRTLRREDLFMYLCMHGAKHGWERLEWICSLSRLVERSTDFNWEFLIETALDCGALRGMYLALLLANDVCALPLPPRVALLALADKSARELADQLRARLFDPPLSHRAHEFQRQASYLRSRERLVDRIRIVWFSCARIPHPLAQDWDLFHLPSQMSFLYYFLRPLRLFRDYGMRILQG